MLELKSAATLLMIFLMSVFDTACHRLELSISNAVDKAAGLKHLHVFCDNLYSLYHNSHKNQNELITCA